MEYAQPEQQEPVAAATPTLEDDAEMLDYGAPEAGAEPAAATEGEGDQGAGAGEPIDAGTSELADAAAGTAAAQQEGEGTAPADNPAGDDNGVPASPAAAAAAAAAANSMDDDAAKAGGARSGSDDVMAMPPHGTEVFMSRLPKEATEAQVSAFCARAGEVYAIRLPKDPGSASHNKGFAFCVYKTKEGAEQALAQLQQQELEDFPGRKVSLVKSEVKNRLFLGNLPRDMSKEAVQQALDAEVKGVTSLELLYDKESGQSRGFGFAEFYNHAAAEAARRALSRPEYRLNGRELTVTWAEPRRTDQAAETVKALYIGGLPERDVDEAALRGLFSAYGQVTQVSVLTVPEDPTKLRGYAFVHFAERAHALRVMTEVESGKAFEIGGKTLSVALAKPQAPRNEMEEGPRGYGGYGPPGRGGYGGPRGPMGGGPPGRGGYSGGYGGAGYSGGRGGPGMGPRGGGRGMAPHYGRGGGGRGYGGPPPPAYGYNDYDEGYGYDGGYDGGYGDGMEYEEADDGYGGYGGYGGAGMMMPMMLPTGQMVYAMAGGPGAGGGPQGAGGGAGGPVRRGGNMPPHPNAPAARSGGAAPGPARSGGSGGGSGATGYGRQPSGAGPTGYGAPRSGGAAAAGGAPPRTGYGAPAARGGAAAGGGSGSGGYVPRGYGQGAGGYGAGARGGAAQRYTPY